MCSNVCKGTERSTANAAPSFALQTVPQRHAEELDSQNHAYLLVLLLSAAGCLLLLLALCHGRHGGLTLVKLLLALVEQQPPERELAAWLARLIRSLCSSTSGGNSGSSGSNGNAL